MLGVLLAAGETGSSAGLEPGTGPTGLDRWLGFCSDNPAAFFLWAAIWDRTLSMLPPEEIETGMTTLGLSTYGHTAGVRCPVPAEQDRVSQTALPAGSGSSCSQGNSA